MVVFLGERILFSITGEASLISALCSQYFSRIFLISVVHV